MMRPQRRQIAKKEMFVSSSQSEIQSHCTVRRKACIKGQSENVFYLPRLCGRAAGFNAVLLSVRVLMLLRRRRP
jgi:hypothetical protein